MKIRMLVSISGHADPNYGIGDFAFAPGQVVDVDKKLAAAWVSAGHAEKIKGSGPAEQPAEVAQDAAAAAQEGA